MEIKMYSALWCSDCLSAKRFLDEKNINYEYIDITNNQVAIDLVKKINNGKKIIPTFIINNKTYTNPGIKRLSEIIRQ